MVWLVSLRGDRSDLEALTKSLNDPQITVSQEGDEFFLTSALLDAQSNAEAVHKEAQNLMLVLNGATRLELHSRQMITIGALHRSRADGKRDTYILAEPATVAWCIIAPTIQLTYPDGTIEKYHPADPVRDWMRVALTDSAVTKVLTIIGSEPSDWINLYRIFEIVEKDCGGLSSIEAARWATKTAIGLFKHTANSPGAIGLAARHGAVHKAPPSKPMTISEARSLINSIAHAWLQSKARRASH